MIEYHQTSVMLQISFFGLFNDVNSFLILMILLSGSIGFISRKLSIAGYGALLVYAHIVMKTDLFIFDAMLYLILIILIFGVGARVISEYLEAKSEAV